VASQTNIEMFSGDTRILEFTVRDESGSVVDLEDFELYWVMKDSQGSTTALIEKDNLELGDGGIECAVPASGVFTVTLSPEDTADLAGVYYFESDIIEPGDPEADPPTEERRSTVAFGYVAVNGAVLPGPTYCTFEEAHAMMADVPITENTIPSIATAHILVATAAREINGVLMGRGIELPVTDAGALDFLKTVNQYGACALIIKSKKPADSGASGDAGAFGYYFNRYRELLVQLSAPEFNLLGTDTDVPTVFSSGFSNSTLLEDGSLYLPFWTRETEF
jgi:hypothetical protein